MTLVRLRSDAWQHQGRSVRAGLELFFPEGGDTRRAKALCAGCPVWAECLAFGLDEDHGVWGGLNWAERVLSQEGNLASVIPLLVESGEVPVAPWVAAAAGPPGVRDSCTAIPAQWLHWLPGKQRRLCQSLAGELVKARYDGVAEEPQVAAG